MQFTTTTTSLLTILSAGLAAPTPQTTVTPGATVPWTITNYSDGCSPAACVYSFNISSPNPPPTGFGPAFNTFCTGNDIQGKLVACEDPSVQSNVVPASGTVGILYIQRTFEEIDGTAVEAGNVTLVMGYNGPYTIQGKFYGVEAS
jgi:hypothetical protein